MTRFTRPDVLVLAGGGVLGEAWMMGVLAGIEDATGIDMRGVESFVGTSAGAIVAARLAAGRRPRRPRTEAPADVGPAAPPTALETLSERLIAPFAGVAMRTERLSGALVRSAVLRLVPRGVRDLDGLERSLERDAARFDGRLRVTAVDRLTGRRVTFGAPGAPPATVPRAVVASCAIPGYFKPVTIAGREYVDGGVWSQTNLDVAPAGLQTEILCLNPIHRLALDVDSPLNAARTILRTRIAVELTTLRRRGAEVRVIGPATGGPAEPMARNLMDGTHADEVLAGGYAQGLTLGDA